MANSQRVTHHDGTFADEDENREKAIDPLQDISQSVWQWNDNQFFLRYWPFIFKEATVNIHLDCFMEKW